MRVCREGPYQQRDQPAFVTISLYLKKRPLHVTITNIADNKSYGSDIWLTH